MADLRDEIPEIDPDKSAATDYALIALDTFVPVVGGAIADLSRGMLARKAEERQNEFNTLVATEVAKISERVNELTPEAILESDEFMAAYSAASRVAAESDSKAKRARLARALSKMGPWENISRDRRARFFTLVMRYSDLHVFLLRYFRDPPAWLRQNAPKWQPGRYMMAGIETVLGEHVFRGERDWKETIQPILGEITADGLGQVPLGTTMSEDGTVQKRTSSLGDQFLDFIGADDSLGEALPPV